MAPPRGVEPLFPECRVLETKANPAAVLKSITAPAETGAAGWAAELVDTAVAAPRILAPQAAYSQIASRAG